MQVAHFIKYFTESFIIEYTNKILNIERNPFILNELQQELIFRSRTSCNVSSANQKYMHIQRIMHCTIEMAYFTYNKSQKQSVLLKIISIKLSYLPFMQCVQHIKIKRHIAATSHAIKYIQLQYKIYANENIVWHSVWHISTYIPTVFTVEPLYEVRQRRLKNESNITNTLFICWAL